MAKEYIIHHGKNHPKDMGKAEVEAFLTALAVDRDVIAATQALAVILFLYREVLEVATMSARYRNCLATRT